MTGVQTCALPICFPVTIAGSGNVFGSGISSVISASNAYWKRDNLFSLRYCNWNKDLFMGILPNSQFGDIAVVDVPSLCPPTALVILILCLLYLRFVIRLNLLLLSTSKVFY